MARFPWFSSAHPWAAAALTKAIPSSAPDTSLKLPLEYAAEGSPVAPWRLGRMYAVAMSSPDDVRACEYFQPHWPCAWRMIAPRRRRIGRRLSASALSALGAATTNLELHSLTL